MTLPGRQLVERLLAAVAPAKEAPLNEVYRAAASGVIRYEMSIRAFLARHSQCSRQNLRDPERLLLWQCWENL